MREVRPLGPADEEAFARFRDEMWPTYSAPGDWETVGRKYFRNPHAALCPESGLYGYFQAGRIAGLMGAYPMPVTFEGAVHAGHMLVDWAIAPRFQAGPVAGVLFDTLTRLPGRKLASSGSPASQRALERRAARIAARSAAAVLHPARALVVAGLGLRPYVYPSPIEREGLTVPGVAAPIAPAEVIAAEPAEPGGTAFVRRDASFWSHYCASRRANGALALRLSAGDAAGDAILRILEVGRRRHAELLSIALRPATIDGARAIGKALRRSLRRAGVAFLLATEADDLWRALLSSVSPLVVRRATHWWAIPRPTDAFPHSAVRWWLTSADRDSHWQCEAPSRATFAGS